MLSAKMSYLFEEATGSSDTSVEELTDEGVSCQD